MNERTILSVDILDDDLIASVVRAPFPVHGGRALGRVKLRADQLPGLDTQTAVLARGRMVRDALRQHQGISGVLDSLSQTLPTQVRPLFVMLNPSEAELINWEMLCDSNEQFVALDPRWPIARIIDPINAPSRLPGELTTPVRLMAVISALGIADQRKEWELLRDAVLAARQTGLPVLLKLLVGDSALHTRIRDEIQQDPAGLADIEVAAIDETAARLTQRIRQWSPNILHFFCHGHAGSAGQWLELATANDHVQFAAHDPGTLAGSINLPSQDLVTLGASLGNPWLMVLNCCSSGQGGNGLQSMANQVVSAGFPAVVAMMEPVEANDAYEFTRAFYPEALAALLRARDELKQRASTTLEWTPIMFHARSAISQLGNRDAQASPEWSLPVLYVRGVEAQVFIRPLGIEQAKSDEFRIRAETTAWWLRTAGQQFSEAERIEALERTLAEKGVPRALWPSADGSFEHVGGQ
ncbi:hypothetical protein GLA29479_2384 [Lysobacter antibioticus]|uniref:CHAT domain-containing protein n=1 Tax=Lysobacter antibioticus TaxID=84531 RepID=UPI0007171BF8|nr:CHAT domain-containing protein [Lysobacter antibioticus]ALN63253.1 hypothetical protein GLA29479_2384 [Lysobacter antibioticus]